MIYELSMLHVGYVNYVGYAIYCMRAMYKHAVYVM